MKESYKEQCGMKFKQGCTNISVPSHTYVVLSQTNSDAHNSIRCLLKGGVKLEYGRADLMDVHKLLAI